MSAATDAIATLQAAVDAATQAAGGSLEDATPGQLAPVAIALKAARKAIADRLGVIEPQIREDSVGGVVAGDPATQTIATFLSQTRLIQEASALRDADASLARLAKNIVLLPG